MVRALGSREWNVVTELMLWVHPSLYSKVPLCQCMFCRKSMCTSTCHEHWGVGVLGSLDSSREHKSRLECKWWIQGCVSVDGWHRPQLPSQIHARYPGPWRGLYPRQWLSTTDPSTLLTYIPFVHHQIQRNSHSRTSHNRNWLGDCGKICVFGLFPLLQRDGWKLLGPSIELASSACHSQKHTSEYSWCWCPDGESHTEGQVLHGLTILLAPLTCITRMILTIDDVDENTEEFLNVAEALQWHAVMWVNRLTLRSRVTYSEGGTHEETLCPQSKTSVMNKRQGDWVTTRQVVDL